MLTDQSAVSDIRQQWNSVQVLKNWSRSVSLVGVTYIETAPDDFYNLPLVLSYSVLDTVLTQMIIEGIFSCPGRYPMLGKKMSESQSQIQWNNYGLIEKGRIDRNTIAHEAKLINKSDCFKYIKAVGDQLEAWQIIV